MGVNSIADNTLQKAKHGGCLQVHVYLVWILCFPLSLLPIPFTVSLTYCQIKLGFWCRDRGGKKGVYFVVSVLSHNHLFATVWTLDHQAPLSMELSKQEYERALPFPPPGCLPNSGIKPRSPVSPALQAGSLPAEPFYQHYASYFKYAAAAAKSLQLCPTLCDPIDGSPPGPAVPGILQARTPEWVAISSSNAWKWKVKVKSLSRVWLLATPWTPAYQAPPSMGFSRQEYWSGVPLPSPLNMLCTWIPCLTRWALLVSFHNSQNWGSMIWSNLH